MGAISLWFCSTTDRNQRTMASLRCKLRGKAALQLLAPWCQIITHNSSAYLIKKESNYLLPLKILWREIFSYLPKTSNIFELNFTLGKQKRERGKKMYFFLFYVISFF